MKYSHGYVHYADIISWKYSNLKITHNTGMYTYHYDNVSKIIVKQNN